MQLICSSFSILYVCSFFFFFQAEDGIRDHCVTGVQTCALPILVEAVEDHQSAIREYEAGHLAHVLSALNGLAGSRKRILPESLMTLSDRRRSKIGRASCRERVEISGAAVSLEQKVSEGR